MKQVKKYFKMISPFNNMQEMPGAIYAVKKMLAFLAIYFSAAVLGEAVIIGGLMAMGYNPLQGDMPTENLAGVVVGLFPYYGFIIFILLTILYCKLVEKRTLRSLGFRKPVLDYLIGAVIAVILLAVIMGICCITGCISFEGMNEEVSYGYLLALLVGFIIQSMGEEILCRGFLMPSLLKKVSVPVAVLVSSTAFALPHFTSFSEMEMKFRVVGILNLYLVSAIFSLLVIYRSNIWGACGLHGVWNFLLYGVFGLNLSGSEENAAGVLLFKVEESNILNGGEYGIEASVITLAVLGVAVVLAWKYYSRDKSVACER